MERILGGQQQIPQRETLPRTVAPVPAWLERLGLWLVWPVVAANLAGTAFGFWFYRFQLEETPVWLWPLIADSPLATLAVAVAFGLWALGRPSPYITAIAFFGNFIYGLWTAWILTVSWEASVAQSGLPMHLFLVSSHLAMVVQALVLHRISEFRLRPIAVATVLYTVNVVVDYFLPIVGTEAQSSFFPVTPHHTRLPVPRDTVLFGGATAYQLAALGAVVGLVVALLIAASIHSHKHRET